MNYDIENKNKPRNIFAWVIYLSSETFFFFVILFVFCLFWFFSTLGDILKWSYEANGQDF